MTKCRSFKPFVHPSSRVLILGSMPGPVALKKQEFYGFDGNHFWAILPTLFDVDRPTVYKQKLSLVKKNKVGLWDVLESCDRPGALDSNIRNAVPNKIPQLLKKFPNIKAIFINGKAAYKIFMKNFEGHISIPVSYLPSTSPANAAMSLKEKIKRWTAIKDFL